MFYEKYKAFLEYVEKKNRTTNLDFFEFIQRYALKKQRYLPEIQNLEKLILLLTSRRQGNNHPPSRDDGMSYR